MLKKVLSLLHQWENRIREVSPTFTVWELKPCLLKSTCFFLHCATARTIFVFIFQLCFFMTCPIQSALNYCSLDVRLPTPINYITWITKSETMSFEDPLFQVNSCLQHLHTLYSSFLTYATEKNLVLNNLFSTTGAFIEQLLCYIHVRCGIPQCLLKGLGASFC